MSNEVFIHSVIIYYNCLFSCINFCLFLPKEFTLSSAENNYQNDEAKFNYQEVYIEVDSSIKLKSWFLNKDLNSLKTLIIFHGNAGDLSNRIYKLNELNKLDINVLLISGEALVEMLVLRLKKIFTKMLVQQLNG